MTDKTQALLPVTHPIEALREMVARDIVRTGATESFMIRSGLLADLLDELASLRQSHSIPGDVGTATCSECDGESKGCTGEYRCLRCNGSGREPETYMGLDNRAALTPSPFPGGGK